MDEWECERRVRRVLRIVFWVSLRASARALWRGVHSQVVTQEPVATAPMSVPRPQSIHGGNLNDVEPK